MILFITGYDRAIIQLRWYLGERPQYTRYHLRTNYSAVSYDFIHNRLW